ncbi:hypothetical protein NYA10_09145 [Burkholderia thailandensis]|nr:hypothetical protein [Burkholderia thailandensis]
MSENSKIEWCDHTSNAGDAGICVCHPMAMHAERFPVAHIETSPRTISERLNVMRLQVASAIVATMHARKFIAAHNVEPPLPAFWRRPSVFSFLRFSVDVTVAVRATRCFLARSLANQRPCLGAVLLTQTIAWSSLRSCAHLGAALGGHL